MEKSENATSKRMANGQKKRRKHRDRQCNNNMDDSDFDFIAGGVSVPKEIDGIKTPPRESATRPRRRAHADQPALNGKTRQHAKQEQYGKRSLGCNNHVDLLQNDVEPLDLATNSTTFRTTARKLNIIRGSKSGDPVTKKNGCLRTQKQIRRERHNLAANGGTLGAARTVSAQQPRHVYAEHFLALDDEDKNNSEAMKLQRRYDQNNEGGKQKKIGNFSKINGNQQGKHHGKGKSKKGKKVTKITPGVSIYRPSLDNRSGESISSSSTNKAVFESPYASRDGGYNESIIFAMGESSKQNDWGSPGKSSNWRPQSSSTPPTTEKIYHGSRGQGSNYASTSGKREKEQGISPNKFHHKKYEQDEDYQEPTSQKKSKKKSDFFPSAASLRRSARKKKKGNEVIILLDSSSDEELVDDNNDADVQEALLLSMEKTQLVKEKVGSRPTLDAVRIAVGKKVFSSCCKIQFQTVLSQIHLHYKNMHGDHEVHVIESDHITEAKYFWSDDNDGQTSQNELPEVDDQLPFIVIRVRPNMDNKLAKYSSSYVQDEKEGDNTSKKWYVVVELRSAEDFKSALDFCKENCEQFEALFSDGARLRAGDTSTYTTALCEDDRQLANIRITRSSKKKLKKGKTKSDDEKVLLVYPFQGSAREIEDAADGLVQVNVLENEAEAEPMIVEATAIAHASKSDDDPMDIDGPVAFAVTEIDSHVAQHTTNDTVTASASSGEDKVTIVVPTTRSHFLTIRNEDMERLEQGEFLNDTLVDFWMQWIWRKEPAESKVHFFTSHFFTTLQENDVQGVSSWTVKKKIDVFNKSFIFLPINEYLHWSLCVVVNPGEIMNSLESDDFDDENNMLCPCIIFLDSLKAHRAKKVASIVRKWLNFEWQRNYRAEKSKKSKPFLLSTMPLFTPMIPYQDNSWDCGVFVCRYAYALYTMYLRGRRIFNNDVITIAISRRKKLKNDVITKSIDFNFDMPEIKTMRDDLKELVTRLSRVYLKSKNTPDSICPGNGNDTSSDDKLKVNESSQKPFESEGKHAESKLKIEDNNEDMNAIYGNSLKGDYREAPNEEQDAPTELILEAEVTHDSIKSNVTPEERIPKADETQKVDEENSTPAQSEEKENDMLTMDSIIITKYSRENVV